MQGCKTRTCVHGYTMGGQTDSKLLCKLQKVVHWYVHWVAKWWKTFIDLHTNLSSTKVDASHCRSSQVNPSGWPNETQVECILVKNLGQLASPFGQGLKLSQEKMKNLRYNGLNPSETQNCSEFNYLMIKMNTVLCIQYYHVLSCMNQACFPVGSWPI